MRARDFITEAATDIVYHYTSTHNAARILKSGVFNLSASTFSDAEAQYAPKGYDFFLSTTRSKSGDYHRYVGTGGVMFVLDGRWLNARYPVKPIDYWERSWQHSPDRTREAEDRVFSKTPEISLDAVIAVHVLLKEQDESRSPLTRSILLMSKTRGIPAYLYTDEAAWRTQNTRAAVSIKDAEQLLRGPQPVQSFRRPARGVPARRGDHPWGRSSVLDWLELINKQPGQSLSATAEKLRYNMLYYGDQDRVLKADLHNARKPGESDYAVANRLIDYLNKNRMGLPDLVKSLQDKWGKR